MFCFVFLVFFLFTRKRPRASTGVFLVFWRVSTGVFFCFLGIYFCSPVLRWRRPRASTGVLSSCFFFYCESNVCVHVRVFSKAGSRADKIAVAEISHFPLVFPLFIFPFFWQAGSGADSRCVCVRVSVCVCLCLCLCLCVCVCVCVILAGGQRSC